MPPIGTHLKQSFKDVYKKYKQYSVKGKQQKQYVKTNFSWDKMKELIEDKLSIVPEFAKQNVLKLPELNLPKLTKLK